jgi:hypothetical protein
MPAGPLEAQGPNDAPVTESTDAYTVMKLYNDDLSERSEVKAEARRLYRACGKPTVINPAMGMEPRVSPEAVVTVTEVVRKTGNARRKHLKFVWRYRGKASRFCGMLSFGSGGYAYSVRRPDAKRQDGGSFVDPNSRAYGFAYTRLYLK